MSEPRTVFDQLLDPLVDCWTPEVAAKIVEQPLADAAQQRIDELADKAAASALTPAEQAEYEEYVEGLDLVGILKAKARTVLAKHAS